MKVIIMTTIVIKKTQKGVELYTDKRATFQDGSHVDDEVKAFKIEGGYFTFAGDSLLALPVKNGIATDVDSYIEFIRKMIASNVKRYEMDIGGDAYFVYNDEVIHIEMDGFFETDEVIINVEVFNDFDIITDGSGSIAFEESYFRYYDIEAAFKAASEEDNYTSSVFDTYKL